MEQTIPVFAWVIVVVVAWVAIAAMIAVVVGRVISRRDRQVPYDDAPVPEPRRAQRARAILRMGRRP